MDDKDTLHIRVSKDMKDHMDQLVGKGLFANKGEVIREVIRNTVLKYKDEIKK